MRSTPLLPATTLANISATLCPSGVMAPRPVMTTLLAISRLDKAEGGRRKADQNKSTVRLPPSALCSLPFANHGDGTLAEVGVADLHRVFLRGGLHSGPLHMDGTGGVGFVVVQGAGTLAGLQSE